MRDMFDNMYTVRIANSGDVAGFPKSHDGLEKAIVLAYREGTEVTFDGEVIWDGPEPWDLVTESGELLVPAATAQNGGAK